MLTIFINRWLNPPNTEAMVVDKGNHGNNGHQRTCGTRR